MSTINAGGTDPPRDPRTAFAELSKIMLGEQQLSEALGKGPSWPSRPFRALWRSRSRTNVAKSGVTRSRRLRTQNRHASAMGSWASIARCSALSSNCGESTAATVWLLICVGTMPDDR